MRKLGLWGCAVLLLALGLTAASAAAPPPDDDDDEGSTKSKAAAGPDPAARPRDGWNPFITRLLGGDDKKPAPKPPEKTRDKDGPAKADAPAPRPSARSQSAAHYRALEQAKLRRRQDVCLRLREVARETRDEDLERKALQLDQRAWEVYLERTRNLPGAESDEESAESSPTRRTGDGDPGSVSVREVKP